MVNKHCGTFRSLLKIQGGADVVFGWRKQRNDPRCGGRQALNSNAKRMYAAEATISIAAFALQPRWRSRSSVIPVNYFQAELTVHSVLNGYVVNEVVFATEHFERKAGPASTFRGSCREDDP